MGDHRPGGQREGYHFLVCVLHALAAHDSRVLDMLATPAPSGGGVRLPAPTDTEDEEKEVPEAEDGKLEPADEPYR